MNVLDTHLLKVQYADDLGTLSFKFRIITTCSNRGIKLPVSCIRCITLNDFSQLYKQMGDGIRTTRIFYVTYTPPSPNFGKFQSWTPLSPAQYLQNMSIFVVDCFTLGIQEMQIGKFQSGKSQIPRNLKNLNKVFRSMDKTING